MKNKYTEKDFVRHALSMRRNMVKMVSRVKGAHLGGGLSIVEILVALYFGVLKIDPANPEAPDRDRIILSKGHCANALYAVLVERGFAPESILETYFTNGTMLTGHPTKGCVPGVEVSTGALGHGLSIGAGMAFSAKYDKKNHRVFVLLSDGECDEGSTWEAAMSAGARKLDNLVAIVDYNKIQSLGATKDILDLEPFKKKWESFGFSAVEVNGHDFGALLKVFNRLPLKSGRPSVIIAHTVKGKGIPHLENTVKSHYVPPTAEELEAVLRELR